MVAFAFVVAFSKKGLAFALTRTRLIGCLWPRSHCLFHAALAVNNGFAALAIVVAVSIKMAAFSAFHINRENSSGTFVMFLPDMSRTILVKIITRKSPRAAIIFRRTSRDLMNTCMQ
jgi:hypothetical protein